jgi:hypothetical protein
MEFGAKSVELGSQRMDLRPKSVEFGSKGVEFGLQGVDVGSEGMEFGSTRMDVGSAEMEFGSTSVDFGSKRVDFRAEGRGFPIDDGVDVVGNVLALHSFSGITDQHSLAGADDHTLDARGSFRRAGPLQRLVSRHARPPQVCRTTA